LNLPLNYAETLKALIDRLLDKGFDQVAGQVLQSIDRSLTGGVMFVRDHQLQQEIDRLMAAKEKLTADNPILRAYLADLGDTLKGDARLIDMAADALLHSAIGAAAQIVPRAALSGAEALQYQWASPDPEAIRAILQYTTDQAWRDMLDQYGTGVAQQIGDLALREIVAGMNPREIGEDISNAVSTIPCSTAQTIMRTLQMTGYRDAQVAHGLANADILQGQVRIAVLDNRTCLSCLALNGSEMDIDERVDDHWNGRCTSVFIVKGRPVDVQSGEDWLNAQTDDRQQTIMGNANYAAWQDGAVSLMDFVQHTSDPLFGDMVQEASLKGILGDAAQNYYDQ